MSVTPSPAGKNGQSVPRAIGQTLATLQHLADLTVDWGCRKLKRVGEYPLSEQKRKSRVVKYAGGAVQSAAKFLGNMGEAYYDWYEQLKGKKAKG